MKKLGNPRLWLAIVTGFIVAGVVLADVGRRKSPGELTTVHGVDTDLDGRWDCSSCHGGWRTSMNQACLECHELIAGQIEAHTGLHGAVPVARERACAACHGEHHGRDFRMVNTRSFTAAGVANPATFEHRIVGWAMDGRHLELDCVKCHEKVDAVSLKKDEHRYGGLSQNCVSCHKDPHDARMALRCVDCHDQQDWKRFAYPEHDRLFALVGPHANRGCRECHAVDTKRSLENAGRTDHALSRECRDCHESPHDDKFIKGVAFGAAMTPGASCSTCHTSLQMSFREPGLTLTAEQHGRSGFPLDPPHEKAKCDACHSSKLETFKQRYPGRREDDCHTCHEDPHGGQFKTGPFSKGGCLACHDRVRFTPHAFNVAKHALASLPLTGSHVEVECNTCHRVPKEKAPRTFRGTEGACDACHSDAHAGAFTAASQPLKKVEHGECARCHDSTKFSNLPATGFDHLFWTRFPLRGAHEESTCEACHPRSQKPDRTHRTFGRVAERTGKFKGCTNCHKDPHGSQFDRKELPLAVEGRTSCERCHDEVSWRSIRGDFDHGTWTGYPLEDAHQPLACAECHAPRAKPDAVARTTDRAKGRTCADCHDDVHGGQFIRDDRNECERCHRSAADFSLLVFKHNVHSRFPLDETHSAVACEGCHKPFKQDGATLIRYRPLGVECADCHEAPSDPLRRRKGKQR